MTVSDDTVDLPVVMEQHPRVFKALKRFLTPLELALVSDDYERALLNGGDIELDMIREVGVSFNPRLSRILSILIKDGGVRDLKLLRAALYGACSSHSLSKSALPPEIESIVLETWSGEPQQLEATIVLGVIQLDLIRHLHQTVLSSDERLLRLNQLEERIKFKSNKLPEWLRVKLEHAIVLQQRSL